MSKYIVITSIFPPTEGIRAFAELKDFTVLVVGDLKTMNNWQEHGVSYLSVEKQKEMEGQLSKILPFNHYCRKMIGYQYAIRNGAEVIIDTDDDNIPKKGWGFPDLEGHFSCILPNNDFINIYELYTEEHIWPRGLPISLINTKSFPQNKLSAGYSKIGIWQGLADEDPDVDAIYRITNNKPCYFKDREPVVLGENTLSPFNSQNTLFRKELFPLLYLPAFVNFRFTDILRSLVAQPIMWLYNYHLGFVNATVIQKRNPHDYFKDFIDEMPMYLHSGQVVKIVSEVISEKETMSNNLFKAYSALEKNKIVSERELILVEAWLSDLEVI